MVIEDFNFVRSVFRPAETEAVLLIDADAELALPVAGEGFQTIPDFGIDRRV